MSSRSGKKDSALDRAIAAESDGRANCTCEIEIDPACPAVTFHAYWKDNGPMRLYRDRFAAWLTPTRFAVLFVALWAVLIALALIYWTVVPIAAGALAWFVPKIAGWGGK